MEQKKKGPQTLKRIRIASGVAAGLFLLYMGAMTLQWNAAAAAAGVFGTVAAGWACLTAAELRGKDKEAVSYNLLWGTGALAILLAGCAAAGIKLLFAL